MEIEDYIETGLYDPRRPKASERLELLQWVETQGAVLEDLNAADIDDLVHLIAQKIVRPGARLSPDEALARTDLSAERFDELRQAAGFPADLGLTEADVSIFQLYCEAAAVFSADELLNFVRVMSTSLSRVTDAAVSLFAADIEAPVVETGGTELQLVKNQLAGISLFESTVPVMEALMRMQMEVSAARSHESSSVGESLRLMGVGFIDLVGYTPQSLDLEARQLAVMLQDFERTAHNAVTDGNGRIVKLIGDEVMFVAVDPSALCAITQSLVAAFASQGQVTPRGGLAYGKLLSLSGDYFGPVVNLASRIADLAVPNEVLVTEELTTAAPDFSFVTAGNRMLKGFPDPIAVWALESDVAG